MFEKEEFDSVSVSTPDHMHGVVGLSALAEGRGKHAYGQKPLGLSRSLLVQGGTPRL